MQTEQKTTKTRTKAYKYFMAQAEGNTKKQSAILAGANPKSTTALEATKTYQTLKENFKDILQEKLSKNSVAQEHIKIIEQNAELPSKLQAIKLYYEITEPENQPQNPQQVNIVLR